MKQKLNSDMKKTILLAAALVFGLLTAVNSSFAQGTTFLYQGQLESNSIPLNGLFDFEFSLYNAAEGGSQVGATLTDSGVGVTNGLFSVTLDFGNAFSGSNLWLSMNVRSNGAGSYTPLTPLQEILPTPYAIFAATASNLSGTLPAGKLTGTIALGQLPSGVLTNHETSVTLSNVNVTGTLNGNGGGLTNLNAANLSGTIPDALLASDVALLDASQTFTGTNIFKTGISNGTLIVQGGTGIDTNLFTGLGLQYHSGSGEGAIMSSFNDGYSYLTFYTKVASGVPLQEQVKIDRYGGLSIDQQDNNNGVIDDGTTNGVGLTFGSGSGEGIASQRTPGLNQNGLDFYTSHNHRMSILHNGNVGIGTTNPATQLQVNGTITATGFSGNASGLTNLSLSQLTGTIPLADLPTSVVTNNETNVTLGNVTVDGDLNLPSTGNIFSGGNTLLIRSGGNFFAGPSAGNLTMSGFGNTGIGTYTLSANTTGTYNTSEGNSALANNLTGNNNTAIGFQALYAITNGGQNTAVGSGALANSQGCAFNTAIGDATLYFDQTGNANTAEGYQALYNNQSGGQNTSIGVNSMYRNTSGNNNTAEGYGALENVTSDSDLVAIGYNALPNDNAVGKGSGSGFGENTAVGYEALMLDTNGFDNTGVGYNALTFNSSGSYNTATGAYALLGDFFAYSSGGGNTADGAYSLVLNTAGYNNTSVGYQTLPGSISDHDNVAMGVDVFQILNGGSANTGIGTYSFQNLSIGDGNIGLGFYAGYDLDSGSNNIYIGNYGISSENNVIRIGEGQSQTYITGDVCLGGAAPQQTLNINGGICVDQSSLNVGNVNNALTFGSGSGEGIGSVRTSGFSDSFGLNFYTDYGNRMTIQQHGNVGIGTTNPVQKLEINGEFMQVDGLGGVLCYMGDDGVGNDVQVGSLASGVTQVSFWNPTDQADMKIVCCSIQINGGCDLAEPFPFSPAKEELEEGAVVVIDEENPGHLKRASQPYDTRVAGVISGANGINPGIQMQQKGTLEGGRNVALTGRVYVQADTSNGPIKPGDLLTTSSAPGRAMKVTDHLRAQGAILGKAMTGLNEGDGMVLVLVSLQ